MAVINCNVVGPIPLPDTTLFYANIGKSDTFCACHLSSYNFTCTPCKEVALRRNLLFLVLCCLVLLASLPPAVPSEAQSTVVSEFGVNSHLASRYGNYHVMTWPADVIASSGAGWVREDFHWFWIEPEPGRFQWDYYDRMVELHTARGTNIIGVLGHPPGWGTPEPNDGYSDHSFYAPDPYAFANFARQVVQRYRTQIVHWEIWNEPDNPQFWLPHPDPYAYANLLSIVSADISQVAPEANILLGGINPFDTRFLRTIAEVGAWWAFDIVNIHPYVDPMIPEANGEIGHAAIANVYSIMNWAGMKPVWVTEFGWSALPSDRDPQGMLNEEDQANYMVRGAVLLRAAGAQRVLWYSIKDERHNGYGMMRFGSNYDDYSQPRPSYHAFTNLNRMLRGAWFERPLHEMIVEGDARVYALRFIQDPASVDVVWSLSPTVVWLPTPHDGVEVVNRDGDRWWVPAENGLVRLYPSESPIYVRQLRS